MQSKKKILIILFIIFIILLVVILGFVLVNMNRDIPFIEYIPQEEISDEQLRQTKVSLYFKCGNDLVSEIRRIDVKLLLVNPYEEILNLLIEGPKNENLEKLIPDGTKINKIEKIEDMLLIDFSEEFLNTDSEELLVNSIVNSLTELVEINKVKIVINGDENKYNRAFERN